MKIGGAAKSLSLRNFNIWQEYKWTVPYNKAVRTNNFGDEEEVWTTRMRCCSQARGTGALPVIIAMVQYYSSRFGRTPMYSRM